MAGSSRFSECVFILPEITCEILVSIASGPLPTVLCAALTLCFATARFCRDGLSSPSSVNTWVSNGWEANDDTNSGAGSTDSVGGGDSRRHHPGLRADRDRGPRRSRNLIVTAAFPYSATARAPKYAEAQQSQQWRTPNRRPRGQELLGHQWCSDVECAGNRAQANRSRRYRGALLRRVRLTAALSQAVYEASCLLMNDSVCAALTLYCATAILPFSSTTKAERMTPVTVLPYIIFSP